jgi:hypothetical protein
MLGYPKDVEQMCLGTNGILSHMKPGYSCLINLVQFWLTTRPVHLALHREFLKKLKAIKLQVLMHQFLEVMLEQEMESLLLCVEEKKNIFKE